MKRGYLRLSVFLVIRSKIDKTSVKFREYARPYPPQTEAFFAQELSGYCVFRLRAASCRGAGSFVALYFETPAQ